MASGGDLQLSSAAAGFTLGFGILTVWKAVKQTRLNKCPQRSVYIRMVWGEILANLILAVLAWLYIQGYVSPK